MAYEGETDCVHHQGIEAEKRNDKLVVLCQVHDKIYAEPGCSEGVCNYYTKPEDWDEWEGEKDCVHYGGVIKCREKKCCGGKLVWKVTVGCQIHKTIYAHPGCREDMCDYFERSEEWTKSTDSSSSETAQTVQS